MFVDDTLGILNEIKAGVEFDSVNKILVWNQIIHERDKLKHPAEITMQTLTNIANSVQSCLVVTWDAPHLNQSSQMPVLDLQVWIGFHNKEFGIPKELLPNQPLNSPHIPKKVVLYQFYGKPMTRKSTLYANSALPDRVKLSTASQEFVRRFKNTSRDLEPTYILTKSSNNISLI